MASNKKLQRKKPGYTKNGEVKIISLSHKQLVELLDKTQRNKTKAKIQNRIRILEKRSDFKKPEVKLFVDGHGDVREVVES